MADKLRKLKHDIKDDDNWEDIITSISCDTFMTGLSGFIDIEHKVIHLDLLNGRKAVILCIDKCTLMAVYDKAQSISDRDFIDIFDDVFGMEDELPNRQEFINLLTEAISGSDPVVLKFIQ